MNAGDDASRPATVAELQATRRMALRTAAEVVETRTELQRLRADHEAAMARLDEWRRWVEETGMGIHPAP